MKRRIDWFEVATLAVSAGAAGTAVWGFCRWAL